MATGPAQHPNVERARKGYDAFARSDLPALLAFFAPDIVWHVGGDGPLSGAHEGIEAVGSLFARIFELTGGSQRLDVEEVVASDDHIVALIHETATRGRDGAQLDVREAHVMRLDADRKVTELWDLPDDPAAHDTFFA
ncbi:MAG: nuclear transport factor 2 family protein [Acidimicrobiales bacterium]